MALFRDMNYNKFHRTLLPCTLSSWLCLQLLLHLVFIQSGMLVVVMGLRLESISVPQSGIKGSSVMLVCEFQLDDDGEKLYSLKWYKDNHEFFRYSPQGPTPIKTFSRPGVLVENWLKYTEGWKENFMNDYFRPSSANRVVFKLKNLRLSSTGIYKCEISADAPTFKTLSKESNLSVIVLPEPPSPQLTSFPRYGQLGDRVRGNCSFSKSYPPAKLTLFVNGAKVNHSEGLEMKVRQYEPQVDGRVFDDYNLSGSSTIGSSSSNGRQHQYHQQQQQASSSVNSNRDGITEGAGMAPIAEKTYTSITGIEIRLEKHHFLRRGQVLNIRCVASVVDQSWDVQTNITLNNFQAPQLSTAGQNRYSSGSEYLVPIFNFVNPSFLSKTVRMGIIISAWTFLLC